MTPHDDLATLRRRVTNYASVSQDHEGLAALSRLEAELARLEAEVGDGDIALAQGNEALTAAGLRLQAAEAEVTRLREERDEWHAEQQKTLDAWQKEFLHNKRLREGLRRIVHVLGPDYFAGELEGLLNEGQEALNIARALIEDRAVEAAVGPAPNEPGASHASESSATARSLLAEEQT